MWGDKCPNCAKKIKKDFSFCPYCGLSFKQYKEQEDFGLLGRDDMSSSPIKIPLGNLDKLFAPLIKQFAEQIDREFSPAKQGPKGFKIQITHGPNPSQNIGGAAKQVINDKEIERRKSLPRKDAESNVRRLSDKVVYEIAVPGVKSKEEISITKLENSVEIKAYSKDACYVKTIPLNADVMGYKIKDGTLVLELKS